MQAFTKLNGSYTEKNNFIWGAALTLAWKNLCKEIIKEPIKVQSDDKTVNTIVENFNNSPCDFNMLNPSCFYAKAGFGNKTVVQINQEVAKKFPEKTTPPVATNLPDDGIISYAYFFKKLLFDTPFEKKDIWFNGSLVPGFYAKTKEHTQQVLVSEYKDDDNFIIELKTKSKKDHISLIKTSADLTPEQVLEKLNSTKKGKTHLQSSDHFQMPKIQIKHNRTVKELIGIFLANQKWNKYFFSEVYEIINLDLDETGVKVENEGVIKILRSGIPRIGRRFLLDKPFWIVMQEEDKHPYFVAHIVNLEK